jgi:hypothetical protein
MPPEGAWWYTRRASNYSESINVLVSRPRQRPSRLVDVLIVAVVLEALLQIPPQTAFLFDHAPPVVEGLPPALVEGIEADHALALVVVEVARLVVVAVDVEGRLAGPSARQEQVVQGVGELGAPVGGVCGHGGGHGEVVRVAGAVTADEGQDEEGGGEIEDEGYEERDEDALGVLVCAM